MMATKRVLEDLLEGLGVTLTELSAVSGLSIGYLCRIVDGTQRPSEAARQRIISALAEIREQRLRAAVAFDFAALEQELAGAGTQPARKPARKSARKPARKSARKPARKSAT